MSVETLETVLKKALATSKRECTIAYQGGEPTLIGLDFFKQSLVFQKKYNVNQVTIHNSIQTNGCLLNEEWAQFLAENKFLVGLSLDGTKEIHDAYRVTSDGKGSFHSVMKAANLLKKYHVDFNILTVVHAQTARHITAIYQFFKRSGFQYLQFIPCLDPLGEEAGQKAYSLTPKAYGDFMKRLFDLWYRDIKSGVFLSVRQFDNYVQMLMGYPPESCGMSGICSCQYVIEADGEVYPCDFYVLDQYKLGNLNNCSFEEIDRRRSEISFMEESYEINKTCQECNNFSICRGGCKRYYSTEFDRLEPHQYFCTSYQEFFHDALPRLQKLARMFLQQR
jgi:Arylsulfatase regulator (Fe-S oxidoreductase)